MGWYISAIEVSGCVVVFYAGVGWCMWRGGDSSGLPTESAALFLVFLSSVLRHECRL